MDFLHSKLTSHNDKSSVDFLMSCHSTPFTSHLHIDDIPDLLTLECPPRFSGTKLLTGHWVSERNLYYFDQIRFVESKYYHSQSDSMSSTCDSFQSKYQCLEYDQKWSTEESQYLSYWNQAIEYLSYYPSEYHYPRCSWFTFNNGKSRCADITTLASKICSNCTEIHSEWKSYYSKNEIIDVIYKYYPLGWKKQINFEKDKDLIDKSYNEIQKKHLPNFIAVFNSELDNIIPFLIRNGYSMIARLFHSHLENEKYMLLFEKLDIK